MRCTSSRAPPLHRFTASEELRRTKAADAPPFHLIRALQKLQPTTEGDRGGSAGETRQNMGLQCSAGRNVSAVAPRLTASHQTENDYCVSSGAVLNYATQGLFEVLAPRPLALSETSRHACKQTTSKRPAVLRIFDRAFCGRSRNELVAVTSWR